MAYYLNNVALGATVSFPGIYDVGNTVGDYFEFSGFATATDANGYYVVAGGELNSNFVRLEATEVELLMNYYQSGSGVKVSAGYTRPPLNTDFVIRVEKITADTWEVFLDGQSLGTGVAPGVTKSFFFDTLFGGKQVSMGYFVGGMYYAKIFKGGVLAHHWDPTAANGTGSVLPDIVGTADGTLVGFPTDNSQWVVTAGAPNLVITQAQLTPGSAISGSYSGFTTIPTALTVSDGTNTIIVPSPTITNAVGVESTNEGTFSGTMPALPTTGTANLVLFGNVTVSLT